MRFFAILFSIIFSFAASAADFPGDGQTQSVLKLSASGFPESKYDYSFTERVDSERAGYEVFQSEFDGAGNCIKNCAYSGVKVQTQLEYYEKQTQMAKQRADAACDANIECRKKRDAEKLAQEKELYQNQKSGIKTTTNERLDINGSFSESVRNRAEQVINSYTTTVYNRVSLLKGKKGLAGYKDSIINLFGATPPIINNVFLHCVWAQRLSFDYAERNMGLSGISPFPKTDGCAVLINTLRREYPNDTFYGSIWKNNAALMAARAKSSNQTEFDRQNTSLENLTKGDIWSTYEHTIMYFGNGQTIGFNSEAISNIPFNNGKIDNVFIGHSKNIVIKKLGGKIAAIKSMSHSELVQKTNMLAGNTNATDDEMKTQLITSMLGVTGG